MPSASSRLDSERQYVIGTAGHIDHGKTALVRALTGIDTDSLPEEKARGITIDLGFAHLAENVTVIDVPGHERLIKNMVAGVSTIDLVLFVVAADDGVMPQSREHLDIIKLLDIRNGIFVMTKCDLADAEWLTLVEEDIRMLLKDTSFAGSDILRTSVETGAGIETLREAIFRQLSRIAPRPDSEVYRQPVDRIFSAKGFGTVITGTVLGGSLAIGDEVDILPAGIRARVRGLQTHDHDTPGVQIGYRSAVNLAGVEKSQLSRGMVLAQTDRFQAVDIVNVRLYILQSAPAAIKNNQRLRLHIHTAEVFARIIIPHAPQLQPGESARVQLRLESPLHAAFRDRFIIRQYSPQRTLGGGIILQTNPARYRKRHHAIFRNTLQRLESETAQDRILGAFDPLTGRSKNSWDLIMAAGVPMEDLQALLKEMVSNRVLFSDSVGGKTCYYSSEQLAAIGEHLSTLLHAYHERYAGRAGMTENELVSQLEKRYPPEAIRRAIQVGHQEKRWVKSGQTVRSVSFTPRLSTRDSLKYRELEALYRDGGFNPPTVKDAMAALEVDKKTFKELIRLLRDDHKLVYISEALFFHQESLPEIVQKVAAHFSHQPTLTVAEFKEITGTTRKHSIPLLEYFDSNGYTERDGDIRRAGPQLGE